MSDNYHHGVPISELRAREYFGKTSQTEQSNPAQRYLQEKRLQWGELRARHGGPTPEAFREMSAANGYPLPWFGQNTNISIFLERTSNQIPIAAISVSPVLLDGKSNLGETRTRLGFIPGLITLTQDYLVYTNFAAASGKELVTFIREDTKVTKDKGAYAYGEFIPSFRRAVGFNVSEFNEELRRGQSIHVENINGRMEAFMRMAGCWAEPDPVKRAPPPPPPPAPPRPAL